MKTKEREKLLAPNARKEAWGLGRPNPAKGRGGCDPGSRLLSFVSKMKVHPGIFMKTKERVKAHAPNAWKAAWGHRRPDPEACRRGRGPDSWLQTPVFCFKNEGASGDIHENKGTGKIARAKCPKRRLGAQTPRPCGINEGVEILTPGSRLLSSASKMKVHPGIFMKTKERENYTSQTPREMFGGSQGGTPAQSDGTPMDRGRQHAGFLPPLAVPPKLPRIIIGSSRREDEWNVPVRNPESPVRAARAELENRNLKFENRKWKLETRKPKLETRKWKPDFRIRQ